MGGVLGELLPLAVGIAISPVPIIAVVLMLLAKQAGPASIGFGIGWVLGIVIATVVFVLLSGLANTDSDTGPSTAVSWLKLVVGILLVLLAVVQWRKRPPPGEPAPLPKWMASIETFTASKAAGLGFLLAAVNPKNLLMAIGAGVAIGSASLSVGQDTIAVVVFTVIAACTVLIPVIAYAVAKDRVTPWLGSLKTWMEANNVAVMSVLLLVIGVAELGKGLGGLF